MSIKYLVIIHPSADIVNKLNLKLDDGLYVQELPNQVCAEIALKNFKYEVKRRVGNVEFNHKIV